MARSIKKGPYVDHNLMKKIEGTIIKLDADEQKLLNRYFTGTSNDDKSKLNIKFDEESAEPLPSGTKIIRKQEDKTEGEEKPEGEGKPEGEDKPDGEDEKEEDIICWRCRKDISQKLFEEKIEI